MQNVTSCFRNELHDCTFSCMAMSCCFMIIKLPCLLASTEVKVASPTDLLHSLNGYIILKVLFNCGMLEFVRNVGICNFDWRRNHLGGGGGGGGVLFKLIWCIYLWILLHISLFIFITNKENIK